MGEAEQHLAHTWEICARKECENQVILADWVEQTRPSVVGIFNGFEEVVGVVGLAEVILYVIIFGRNPQLDELSLEGSALLKEAMYFSFYLPSS